MRADVIVIGAGQAGLSAGYHLARRGFVDARTARDGDRTFVIFDAAAGPGGAWRHRWPSLSMATVNGIFDLPDFPKPTVDPAEASRDAVPRYFAAFEDRAGLPIQRPVTVTSVTRADDDPGGDLVVATSAGPWRARAIVNATGTFNNPVLPEYPGHTLFTGRQLHSRDYLGADEFTGQRVGVVGGGISALQQLAEISGVATVHWYTRREPVFHDGDFRPEIEGRETIAKVTADVEAGRPVSSVVSYTGLLWTPYARRAAARGALDRRPMFTALEPGGVREADGSFTALDTLLWATGYRADLAHLAPLGLRNELGGIAVDGTRVRDEPRVHLIGFGPSASTVGANRAGRRAARDLVRWLG
ncbi:flavin-containing monooxygenase [Gordonia phosphorivorans]|uniref:Flavin-containing monooxygenase n=1 Tax=Gordonia phosphorivorans TaxID=1056982 RepID=A0ABV6H8H7_9ACTN